MATQEAKTSSTAFATRWQTIMASKPRWLTEEKVVPFLMVLPSIIVIAVFVYGFIAWSAYVSMSAWDSIRPDYTWVGFANYERLFRETRFQADIRNTIVFTAFFLGGCLTIGITLAMLLDQRIRGENFYRSLYIFPMAVSFIVTGTIWRWIFMPGNYPMSPTGINLLLDQIGLGAWQWGWITDATVWPGWRPEDSTWRARLGIPVALLPVTLAAVWQMSGFTMAMYIAGLRGISDEIKEAALVDGASQFQLLRYVMLPLLKPVTFSAMIVLGHVSLKIFDLIMAMTGGGPANATDMLSVNMYFTVFQSNRFAQGAAISMIMLLMVAVLIIPYLVHEHREGRV